MDDGHTSPPHDRARKVLLVEDDPRQRFLLRRMLGRADDLQIGFATNASEALEMLEADRWWLLVCDLGLPDMPGLDLVRTARAKHPSLPVLVLSASDSKANTLGALRAGATDYLVKPPTRRSLEQAIRRHLKDPAAREASPSVPKRVLAIGAHPDDVEIGCGGTLLGHRDAGDELLILTLSSGERGGAVGQRSHESRAAAEQLGASLMLHNFPDTELSDGPPTIQAIERAIAEFKPDLIYTHTAADRHQDHRAVHRATLVAARKVPIVLGYQSPSSTLAFQPRRFVDVSGQMEAKKRLISLYSSQTSKCAYLEPEVIESTARYWGRFANYGCVEAFEVIREVRESQGRRFERGARRRAS